MHIKGACNIRFNFAKLPKISFARIYPCASSFVQVRAAACLKAKLAYAEAVRKIFNCALYCIKIFPV